MAPNFASQCSEHLILYDYIVRLPEVILGRHKIQDRHGNPFRTSRTSRLFRTLQKVVGNMTFIVIHLRPTNSHVTISQFWVRVCNTGSFYQSSRLTPGPIFWEGFFRLSNNALQRFLLAIQRSKYVIEIGKYHMFQTIPKGCLPDFDQLSIFPFRN